MPDEIKTTSLEEIFFNYFVVNVFTANKIPITRETIENFNNHFGTNIDLDRDIRKESDIDCVTLN